MSRRVGESQSPVIPWRFAAILVGSILALGVAGGLLALDANRRSRSTYDAGVTDPADFSREEEAVRMLVVKGNPRLAERPDDRPVEFVQFGPNYRFTKHERDMKRIDVGYMARMRVLRRWATDPTDPPATAVRVVYLEPSPGRPARVVDMVYILDGRLETVFANTNGHGGDWIRWTVPDWR